MGFLGFRSKRDDGLVPIVQRAPVAVASLSNVSAHLVPPKAVVRSPAPLPRVEALPPLPAPPPRPPAQAPRSLPVPVAPVARPAAPAPPAPTAPAVPPPVLPPVPLAAPPPATWGPPRIPALTHLRQGVVLQAQGDHGRAILEFSKAIQADSSCIEAYASRGISREVLGDLVAARADYAKSIEVEVRAGIARHLAVARDLGI